MELITPAVFRVKVGNKVFTINHDRVKLCRDRQLPIWISKLMDDNNLLEEALKAAKKESANQAVFCHCRKPDDGKLMIQCETCLEWFHGACIGVARKNLGKLGSYTCPQCVAVLGSDP